MSVKSNPADRDLRILMDVSIDQIVASLRGREDSTLLSIMDRLADMVSDKQRVKDWAWDIAVRRYSLC